MQFDVSRNASRNIKYGTGLKVYQVILSFILRTVIIYTLGIKFVGLGSLFTSVMSFLNLAESGVGTALVFMLYKPIAKDDDVSVCGIVYLMRFYYIIIGGIVCITGLLVIPFLPYLVKDSIPSSLNLMVLYLLNLASSVASYWFFAYNNNIFIAYQRNDVLHRCRFVTSAFQYALQILVLLFLHDYYYFLVVALFSQLAYQLYAYIFVHKYYPGIHPVRNLEQAQITEIHKKVRALFLDKIGGILVNSADAVIISAFLGLTILGRYQNYFVIVSGILQISAIVENSCLAGLGNKFVSDSKEKNYFLFRKMTFLSFVFCAVCVPLILNVIQPFIMLWVGKANMLSYDIVFLFCLYFVFYKFMMLFSTYEDSTGIWYYDRFRPLLEGALNLIMNIVMVSVWGLSGVLLSTIISMACFSLPWLLYNIMTHVFDDYVRDYMRFLFKCAIPVFFCSMLSFALCRLFVKGSGLSVIMEFVVCICICLFVSFLIIRILFHKTEEYRWTVRKLHAFGAKVPTVLQLLFKMI